MKVCPLGLVVLSTVRACLSLFGGIAVPGVEPGWLVLVGGFDTLLGPEGSDESLVSLVFLPLPVPGLFAWVWGLVGLLFEIWIVDASI